MVDKHARLTLVIVRYYQTIITPDMEYKTSLLVLVSLAVGSAATPSLIQMRGSVYTIITSAAYS